ncbi:uncharacterized protein BDV14DRAFT_197036 [Aspergillus stella-maris]|uniref:uncharacterized protein n=1 Tax=Aspergillus stella-maris TaxID=1810926 RepID=UPI003CCD10FA
MPPSPPPSTNVPSDTDLESDLLSHLATTHALEDLHSTLLSTLQRLGWTEKIRRLSTELLRANRCERFDDVLEAVVASAQGRSHPGLSDAGGDGGQNGNGDTDGADGGYSFEIADVKIPRVVVEQGVRAIKECLREVVVLEDDEGAGGSGGGGGKSNIAVEVGGEGSSGSGSGTKRQANGDTSPAKKADKKAKKQNK